MPGLPPIQDLWPLIQALMRGQGQNGPLPTPRVSPAPPPADDRGIPREALSPDLASLQQAYGGPPEPDPSTMIQGDGLPPLMGGPLALGPPSGPPGVPPGIPPPGNSAGMGDSMPGPGLAAMIMEAINAKGLRDPQSRGGPRNDSPPGVDMLAQSPPPAPEGPGGLQGMRLAAMQYGQDEDESSPIGGSARSRLIARSRPLMVRGARDIPDLQAPSEPPLQEGFIPGALEEGLEGAFAPPEDLVGTNLPPPLPTSFAKRGQLFGAPQEPSQDQLQALLMALSGSR